MLDTFCCVTVTQHESQNFPHYLEKAGDFVIPFSENLDKPHWFFSVRNLELLVGKHINRLGDFDERPFADHPSMKSERQTYGHDERLGDSSHEFILTISHPARGNC
jgi:hypothetical protein